jgi:signal transduction histidine kinase
MEGGHLMLSVEPLATCRPYAVPMVGNSVRAIWDEPRPARPPTRVWRDWALLAVVVAGSVLEVVLREDRARLEVAIAVSLVIGCALLWRRTHPLAAVAVAFGTLIVFDLARIALIDAAALYSTAAALVLSYALFRWGAGREAALGASIRFHANARLRAIEQAKLRLRNELARELHDTVGHYVSGIAIQAQAGRALAASHPDRALAVLETIEEAASRTLEQMRAMVGILREEGAADLAPQPGIADVERLAREVGGWPRVEVHLAGDLDDLSPTVGAALYRTAQEAVTNTMRHARNATRVSVEIRGQADRVHLSVRDDGDTVPTGAPTAGYGLLGMTERVPLLGGTVRAGPAPTGGWTVEATLPRGRPTTAAQHAAERRS